MRVAVAHPCNEIPRFDLRQDTEWPPTSIQSLSHTSTASLNRLLGEQDKALSYRIPRRWGLGEKTFFNGFLSATCPIRARYSRAAISLISKEALQSRSMSS